MRATGGEGRCGCSECRKRRAEAVLRDWCDCAACYPHAGPPLRVGCAGCAADQRPGRWETRPRMSADPAAAKEWDVWALSAEALPLRAFSRTCWRHDREMSSARHALEEAIRGW